MTLSFALMLAAAAPLPATRPDATPPTVAVALPPAAAQILHTGTDSDGRMTVAVRIGAKGPYAFLIDTGAETTVLSTALATRLGLPHGAPRNVMGVAGARVVDTVALAGLRLGRRALDSTETPLLDGADLGADGIVGLDALQGQRVLLDFAAHRITFASAAALQNGDFEIVVTARRRGGQLILTRARIDGVLADVVIDTGAESSIAARDGQPQQAARPRA